MKKFSKQKKTKEFSFSNKFFNLGLNDSYKGFVKIFFEKFTDNWVRNAPFQFYSNLKYQVFKWNTLYDKMKKISFGQDINLILQNRSYTPNCWKGRIHDCENTKIKVCLEFRFTSWYFRNWYPCRECFSISQRERNLLAITREILKSCTRYQYSFLWSFSYTD